MITLRVVSETASTITFGWDPVPGAVGYRFSSSDSAKRSHTWDPSQSSVKFSKGADWYRVEALDVVDEGVWPAPEPPPPPPSAALFDGRATLMTSLKGSTVKVGDSGWAGGSNALQTPLVWGEPKSTTDPSGLYFMTDSISLVADAKYQKVYRCNVGPGDTNPYFNQPTRPNGELTKSRPLAQGQVDWYAEAFKIVAPYTVMDFNVICQYGYPSLASPPLSISFDSRGLGIDRHVGILIAQSDLSGPGTIIDKPRFWPVADVLDKWVEMVIGVKWNVTATGWVEVWARVQGESSFTQKYVKTNTPTWQQVQGQSIKTSGNDKMGLYFGTSSAPPTNTVLHRGFQRFADEASARAALGNT